jgi:uncharacterized protein YjbJ (UPF0337 family)
MTNVKEKLAGKAKQVVAEVTGDGKLAQEGKEQSKKADTEPAVKPFGNLDKLT